MDGTPTPGGGNGNPEEKTQAEKLVEKFLGEPENTNNDILKNYI